MYTSTSRVYTLLCRWWYDKIVTALAGLKFPWEWRGNYFKSVCCLWEVYHVCPSLRLMWFAGIFASISTLIYPAISALVSKNASPEEQGVVLGILTGMRGLCNGLGPAIFGFLFWMFDVHLSEDNGRGRIASNAGVSSNLSSINVSTTTGLASEVSSVVLIIVDAPLFGFVTLLPSTTHTHRTNYSKAFRSYLGYSPSSLP